MRNQLSARAAWLGGAALFGVVFAGSVSSGCGGSIDSSAFTDDAGGTGADTGSASGDAGKDSTVGPDGAPTDTGGGSDTGTSPDGGPLDEGVVDAIPVDSTLPDVTPVDTGPVTPCGDLGGKIYNGHCYLVLKQRSYAENTTVCNGYGGYLAAITTDGEQAFVQGLYPGADVWIGLIHPDGGKFDKWTDGETIGFTHWASGEPNGSGNCARIIGGGGGAGYWGDTYCGNFLNGICERNTP